MNTSMIKLAIESGLIDYVDNETPRRYFVHACIDIDEVEHFGCLIAGEVLKVLSESGQLKSPLSSNVIIAEHFEIGVD